jgi:hypothetical protein
MSKKTDKPTIKSSRSYISNTTKAATHPVRSQILKALKEGDRSTVELEAVTGEARYNLYHHLNALEEAGFIGWAMKDNKTKLFHLKARRKPREEVIVLNTTDIQEKPREFRDLVQALANMQGDPIEDFSSITNAEIYVHFSRSSSAGKAKKKPARKT